MIVDDYIAGPPNVNPNPGPTPNGAQGRIVLSADQRQYAGITNVAWIVGVNNLIEVWNDENWRRIGEATPEEYTRIQDQVAERRRVQNT